MDRPKIKIVLDKSDYLIEFTGVILILLMFCWPLYYFNELPEMIPRHFNANGEPDAYSEKNIIWLLPITGVIMYIGLFYLNKFPHIFNYLTEINEVNAERQYRLATKLVRSLNLLIAGSFFYIVHSTIRIALNKQDGLGSAFLPLFLFLIFGVLGIFIYRAFKKL